MNLARDLLRVSSWSRTVIIGTFLLGFIALVILFMSSNDVYSNRLPMLPTAQAQYQEILTKISSATNDQLLTDRMDAKPQFSRVGIGCIIAQGERVYGANRPQTAIVADYSKVFSAMGWDHTDTSFGTKTSSVIIVFLDTILPDYQTLGKGKYETLYRVQVVYADPQMDGCFG